MPEAHPPRQLTTCFEKLRWHAFRAEETQAQIEEMEDAAAAAGAGQQHGRMERTDGSTLPDSYMGNVLLRDRHQYLRLVAIRNSHQAQILMYATLIGAGIDRTAHRRKLDGDSYRLELG